MSSLSDKTRFSTIMNKCVLGREPEDDKRKKKKGGRTQETSCCHLLTMYMRDIINFVYSEIFLYTENEWVVCVCLARTMTLTSWGWRYITSVVLDLLAFQHLNNLFGKRTLIKDINTHTRVNYTSSVSIATLAFKSAYDRHKGQLNPG